MNQMIKFQPFHQSGIDRLERQKIFKDIYLSPIACKGNYNDNVRELEAALQQMAAQYNATLLYIFWPEQRPFTDQYGDNGHVYCRFTAGPRYKLITDPNQCQNTTIQQLYQLEQGQQTMYNKLQSWSYCNRSTAVKNSKATLLLWEITANIQNYQHQFPRQLAITAPPTTVSQSIASITVTNDDRPESPESPTIWNPIPNGRISNK
jgi:hypothetical protein